MLDRTTRRIRYRRDGYAVAAAVAHVDGRIYALQPDNLGLWSPGPGDLHSAIQIVAAELEATHTGHPAPIVDRLAWIATLAEDRRVKRTSGRVAAIIAQARPGQRLSLRTIGGRLRVDYRNVGHAIDRLVEHGYISKTRDGNRTLYQITMPESRPW